MHPGDAIKSYIEMHGFVRVKFDKIVSLYKTINHFTVMCLVAWHLNESEAGVDLV